MRVFLTGATGFIGSYLVPELINAGHHVVGLSRSDAGAEALTGAGAEVFRGDVNDLDRLRTAAEAADGIIHAAFNHDFSNLKQNSENDRKVIETLGEVLVGSARPLVIASGTGLVARSKTGGPAVETDDHVTSAEFPRAATEEAADALIAKGRRVMVMRLPQVHDARHQGRIAQHIQLARQKGPVATPLSAQIGPTTYPDMLAQFDAWVEAADGCHWEIRTRSLADRQINGSRRGLWRRLRKESRMAGKLEVHGSVLLTAR